MKVYTLNCMCIQILSFHIYYNMRDFVHLNGDCRQLFDIIRYISNNKYIKHYAQNCATHMSFNFYHTAVEIYMFF